jgi:hypothetical protein
MAGGSGGGAGGGDAALAAALAADGGDKGGGGGGSGALLGGLLWGGGAKGIMGLGAGLAAFGSLGSFAGLGPEHVLMTGLGLAGSAVGAGLGGGLLAAGALGPMAVGGLTDMAGIGQAAGDLKTVYGDMNSLSQAVALYGKNSTQAAQAQAQLNYDLAGFSPVARGAVLQAANTAEGFKSMFDAATGGAEKIGAEILTQAMQVGEKFLPTIGTYAAQNMGIIQQSLQPLFSWLQSPGGGLGIFTDLEHVFQEDLPTAMHAFDMGVEIVAKTFDYLTTYLGGFMPKLDEFLTKMNSPAGFAKWETVIAHLIGDFEQWKGLVEIVVKDIVDLFKNDAGTAGSIVGDLTQMLQKLNDWENSTSGKSQLHNIFEVHKQEIDELLQILPKLVEGFGSIYLHVAPVLTQALNNVLSIVIPVLSALDKNPFGAWLVGIGLLAGKFGLLTGPLQALGKVAFDAIAGGLKSVAVSMGILDAASDANPIGAVVLGLLALGLGLAELVQHFKAVTTFLNGPWGTAISAALVVLDPFLGVPMIIIGHWQGIVGFFRTLWAGIVYITGHAVGGVIQAVEDLGNVFFSVIESILGAASHLPFGLGKPFADALHAVQGWQSSMDNTLNGAAATLYNLSFTAGTQMGAGLVNGINTQTLRVQEAAAGLSGQAAHALNEAALIHSPSELTYWSGQMMGEGFALGMEDSRARVEQAARSMVSVPGGSLSGRGSVTYSPHYGDIVVQGGATNAQTAGAIKKALDQHDKELLSVLNQRAGMAI